MNFKTAIILTLMVGSTLCAHAQDIAGTTTTKKQYIKNELGLYGETSFGNTNISGPVGIMYKRWVHPNVGYRLNLGYGEYNGGSSYDRLGISGDTVIDRYRNTAVPAAFLGGGIEVQKQFYKKIFLYATLEARVGYGSGTTHDEIIRTVINGTSNYFSSTPTGNSENITYFSVATIPSIGAKFQFKRLSLGTDITAINTEYVSTNSSKTGSVGTLNVEMGSLRQRVYLLYRF